MDIDYKYLKEIENKIKNKISVTYDEIDYFLKSIIYLIRDKVRDNEHPYFEYKCDLVQSIICHYLNELNVTNFPNATNKSILDNVVGHSFVVATFKVDNRDVDYLIDPTYIQFFKKENIKDGNYIIINGYIVKTPDPGYFIKKEDIDKINLFNENGFSILDEDIARIYGNSFYNTRTMKKDKTFEELKGYVYINSFLKGKERLSKSKLELEKDGYLFGIPNVKIK